MAPDIPNKPKSGGKSQRRRKRRAFASMPQPVSQPVPESAEAIASELQVKRLALMTRLHPDTWRFSLSKPNVMYALDDNTLRYIYRTLSLEYPFALLKRVIDVWKDQGEGDSLGLGMFGQPEGPSFLVRQVVAGYLLATEYDRDMQSDEDKDDSLPDVSESLMMELKKGLELMAGGESERFIVLWARITKFLPIIAIEIQISTDRIRKTLL